MSSESPPTLESEECDKLLDTLLNDARTPKQKRKAVRNHCMALLMLDAGLRVGELVSLRLSDLYFNREPVRTIFIKSHMTKNKLEHSIPVSDRLSNSLSSYSQTYHLFGAEPLDAFAFRRDGFDDAITTRQVERIICSAGLKAFGRPVHPHMLRHTAASRWMRVTNEAVVQGLLGHKYLSSTQVYCHPNEDDKRQAIESASSHPDPLPPFVDHKVDEAHPDDLNRPEPLPASPSARPPFSPWKPTF